MSENNTTEKVEETKAEEVKQVTANSTPAVAASKLNIKDLLVPLSIVIAGVAVGAGLYFSGGQSPTAGGKLSGTDPTGPTPTVADTANKVDPVTEADHIKGSIKAPVKIVEYSDFECPFCKRHHTTLQGVIEKMGEDKVAWVFRQFPLDALHPVKARAAAMASECVAEQGGNDAFWIFTDRYFEDTLTNNKTDIETLIPKLVAETGVNKQKFNECFEGEKFAEAIDADILDATETGGTGTPWTIIIGPSGKTYTINGSQPADVIEKTIEKALKEA